MIIFVKIQSFINYIDNMFLKSNVIRLSAVAVFFFIFFSASSVNAQNSDQTSRRSGAFFVGGNLGLQFGTVTLVDISPMVGYFFTENWNVGVGGTYKYYRYKLLDSEYTSTYYGGRAFSQLFLKSEKVQLLNYLFLHGEYEYLNLRFNANESDAFDDTTVESYFGGVGYRAPLSSKVAFSMLLLYNFNDSANSPYENPVIRVGVSVRL